MQFHWLALPDWGTWFHKKLGVAQSGTGQSMREQFMDTTSSAEHTRSLHNSRRAISSAWMSEGRTGVEGQIKQQALARWKIDGVTSEDVQLPGWILPRSRVQHRVVHDQAHCGEGMRRKE